MTMRRMRRCRVRRLGLLRVLRVRRAGAARAGGGGGGGGSHVRGECLVVHRLLRQQAEHGPHHLVLCVQVASVGRGAASRRRPRGHARARLQPRHLRWGGSSVCELKCARACVVRVGSGASA